MQGRFGDKRIQIPCCSKNKSIASSPIEGVIMAFKARVDIHRYASCASFHQPRLIVKKKQPEASRCSDNRPYFAKEAGTRFPNRMQGRADWSILGPPGTYSLWSDSAK